MSAYPTPGHDCRLSLDATAVDVNITIDGAFVGVWLHSVLLGKHVPLYRVGSGAKYLASKQNGGDPVYMRLSLTRSENGSKFGLHYTSTSHVVPVWTSADLIYEHGGTP